MNPDRLLSENQRRVLIIDDSASCRMMARFHLPPEVREVIEAADGTRGLELAQTAAPDLILLDLHLPDCLGFELIRRLKDDPRTRSIPVIFLSGSASSGEKARGLDLGAADFLSKSFEPIELQARVRAALRTKDLQDLLEQRAQLDGLTGLGNRLALEERLAAEWSNSRRRGTPMALLIADLDHFKRINDEHGHAAGDVILRGVAQALRASVRAGDFVARFGGEEFLVVAPDCDVAGAMVVAERFRSAVDRQDFQFRETTLRVTTSVGLAATHAGLIDPTELLTRADQALYAAKSAGRDSVRAWEPPRSAALVSAVGAATPTPAPSWSLSGRS